MAGKVVPGRRGVARNYTLDHDALKLLEELTESRKGHGRFISALLRAEAARREERQRVREAIEKTLEVVCP